MKTITFSLFLALICSFGFAQNKQIDSLKHHLTIVKKDTSGVLVLLELCNLYRQTDSCLIIGKQALNLAHQINFTKGELKAIFWVGLANRDKGNYPQAFAYTLKGLRMSKNQQYLAEIADLYHLLGICYTDYKDYKNAIFNLQIAYKIKKNAKLELRSLNDLTLAYIDGKQLDSASYYGALAYQIEIQKKESNLLVTALRNLGKIQFGLGNYDKALDYYRQSNQLWKKLNIANKNGNNSYYYNLVGAVYLKINKIDSCIFYAKEALLNAKESHNRKRREIESYSLLVEAYKKKEDYKQAFENLKSLNVTTESLYGASNSQAIQTIIAQDQEQQKQTEIENIANQNKLKLYGLLAGLAMLLLISFILYRNNLKEKKAKNLLHQQKEEIQTTLSKLKATQAQLIQSEKLASLGELTAGIAHEIQNPLNFVNNFSELSVELLEEMESEFKAGKPEDAFEIAVDIKLNLSKINHHGQRASSIVKGMLEHSRVSTGVKEPTDLNALADEFLRLAYHGLRAKDNNLNAMLETHFDPDLPLVSVIPQDIGRVLLNLINNAFYAVHQPKGAREGHPYEPTVTVSTKKLENAIEISVQDNGNGIPEAIRDKIFQPFFTTKPTGQGTGLGLSLAYDIVTKGHGGTINLQSNTGEGTTFSIWLPI